MITVDLSNPALVLKMTNAATYEEGLQILLEKRKDAAKRRTEQIKNSQLFD